MSEEEAYRAVVHELSGDPAVSEAQMMGMAVLKIGSKLFGGVNDGDLVLKVGRERAQELIATGRGSPFDPSGRGRPMGGWVQVPEPADDWLALAEEAKGFVAGG